MKHSLRCLAVLACLSSSLSAQWAHERPGTFLPASPYRFVFTELSPLASTILSNGQNSPWIGGAAADLGGGRVYVIRNVGNLFLHRWSFGSSAETVVGNFQIDGQFLGFSAWDATFANGQLFVTSRHPTGAPDRPNRIYALSPTTLTGSTWLGEQASYFNPKGLAYDSSANRLLVTHYQDAPTPGTLAPGVYAVDLTTKAISFFTALPPAPSGWHREVAQGRLWSFTTGNALLGVSLTNPVNDSVSVTLTSPAAGALAWAPGMLDNCAGASYCTAGTSTAGCVPTMCASGVPSASSPSGFTLTVDDLDGQRSGLVLYGVSGPLAAPWSPTSTSYRCVNNPVQRMGTQNSGGAAGTCSGQFVEDWNAYRATHPGALGQPFSGGESVWSQGWYRDPAASKSSGLSNGLQFVVQP